MKESAILLYVWHGSNVFLAATVPALVLAGGIHNALNPGKLDAEFVPSEDITGLSDLVNIISYLSNGSNW